MAAVVLNNHSLKAQDATRTALGSDSMQTERHAYNRTKAVPPKACHHPCSVIGYHLFYYRATAIAFACSLCQDRVSPSCLDFGPAPLALADWEYRWRQIEHLLFECPGILSLRG